MGGLIFGGAYIRRFTVVHLNECLMLVLMYYTSIYSNTTPTIYLQHIPIYTVKNDVQLLHTLFVLKSTHLYVCYYYTPYQGVLLLHTVACVKSTHLRCVSLRNYTPFVCSSDTTFCVFCLSPKVHNLACVTFKVCFFDTHCVSQ